MRISELLLRLLNFSGIRIIFGYPGETSLRLYADLKQFKGRHIMARCERCAVHMADAYARVTNNIGVVEVPKVGALWTPPALLEAKNSSIPILMISSGTNTKKEIKHPTCEYNQLKMLEEVSIAQIKVKDPKKILSAFHNAKSQCIAGKPGPVILEIPSNIFSKRIKITPKEIKKSTYTVNNRMSADENSIKRAFRLLEKVHRPIIIAGGGIHGSQAYSELLQFAEKMNIPVGTTSNGKGAFDETHPLSLGVVGEKGDVLSNRFLSQADLFFTMGTKLGDKSTNQYSLLKNGAKLIQLDINPSEIGSVLPVELGIIGDIKKTLTKMSEFQKSYEFIFDDCKKELEYIRKSRFKLFDHAEALNFPVAPSLLFKSLNKIHKGKGVIVADGSTACGWASVFSITKGGIRANVNPRGTGMIGYGFPATIGAVMADIKRPIIGVGGDGGFYSTMHEIETAVRYNLDLTFFILDDQKLTFMEVILDKVYHKKTIPQAYPTDWVKIVKAMGGRSQVIHTNQELLNFLKKHKWIGVNIIILEINKNLIAPDLQMNIQNRG